VGNERFDIGWSRGGKRCSVWALSDLLEKHILVVGQSGAGKTRWLAQFVNFLIDQDAACFVLDFKGDLVRLVSRHVTRRYLGKRAVFFDPGGALENGSRVPNVNIFDGPYHSARKAAHFKTSVKTLFRSPGQASVLTSNPWLDETLLLIGNLLAAAPSPEGAWTIFEALAALSPKDSTFRNYLLGRARNPFLERRFLELDEYRFADRCAMVNPVIARLMQLLLLRPVAAVLGGSKTTIAFDRLLERAGIFLGLFEHPQIEAGEMAFVAATAFLKIKEAVFARTPRNVKRPCFLVIDEAARLVDAGLGDQLADLLERSRSYGCQIILSSQFLTQYVPQDSPHNTRLLESVVSQTAIKVAFRTSRTDAEVLKLWAELYSDLFHQETHRVKHQVISTVLKPVLTWLDVHSYGTASSRGGSTSVSEGRTETDGESDGSAHAESVSVSTSTSHGRIHSHAKGSSHAEGESSFESSTDGLGHSDLSSTGTFDSESFPADGMHLGTLGEGVSSMSGSVDNSFSGFGSTSGRSSVTSESESEAMAKSRQHSRTRGRGTADVVTSEKNRSESRSASETEQENWSSSDSHSVARHPFYLYREEEQEGARTFYSPEEVREGFINSLTQQDKRQFVVKNGITPALKLSSCDYVEERVSQREVERLRRRTEVAYTQPTAEVMDALEKRVPRFLEEARAASAAEDERRRTDFEATASVETEESCNRRESPKPFQRRGNCSSNDPVE
jgi:hypothetical protein